VDTKVLRATSYVSLRGATVLGPRPLAEGDRPVERYTFTFSPAAVAGSFWPMWSGLLRHSLDPAWDDKEDYYTEKANVIHDANVTICEFIATSV
jgi:hypothetical protein